MTSPTLSITVVVPTYRRPDMLQSCLTALAGQERPADEIVLVVRDTDVESIAVIERWTERLPIRTVAPEAPGYVPALAAGLGAVKTDIVAWTDDDAEPLPDWLTRMAGWFADPHISGVGGPDLPGTPGPASKRFGAISYFGRVYGGTPAGDFYVGPVEHLRGCNMAIRMPVPLPELRLTGDGSANEMDICLQAGKTGTIVFDSRIGVLHEGDMRVAEEGIVTDRPETSPAAAKAAAFNLCLVLSKNIDGPALRRIAILAFQLGVGQRQSLGLIRGLMLTVQERDAKWLTLTIRVMLAKTAGWREGRRRP